MKCPICKDVDLLMTERSGVEIDYCPQCRGIWLDRGELDKLLEKAEQSALAGNAAPTGQPVTGYSHGETHHHKSHHGHGNHGYSTHQTRRRSWLGNLLDFD